MIIWTGLHGGRQGPKPDSGWEMEWGGRPNFFSRSESIPNKPVRRDRFSAAVRSLLIRHGKNTQYQKNQLLCKVISAPPPFWRHDFAINAIIHWGKKQLSPDEDRSNRRWFICRASIQRFLAWKGSRGGCLAWTPRSPMALWSKSSVGNPDHGHHSPITIRETRLHTRPDDETK